MVMVLCNVPHRVARWGCLMFVPVAKMYHVLKIVTVNMQIIAYNAIPPESLHRMFRKKAPRPALNSPEYHFLTFPKATSGNTGSVRIYKCGV